MSVLSVEIDEALKAGHAVDVARDMQLWASAVGRLPASSAYRVMEQPGRDESRRVGRRGDRGRVDGRALTSG